MTLWELSGNESEDVSGWCYLIGLSVFGLMLMLFFVVYTNREGMMRRWRKCQSRKRRWNREMMRHFGRIAGLR